jgi:hypothetical protein
VPLSTRNSKPKLLNLPAEIRTIIWKHLQPTNEESLINVCKVSHEEFPHADCPWPYKGERDTRGGTTQDFIESFRAELAPNTLSFVNHQIRKETVPSQRVFVFQGYVCARDVIEACSISQKRLSKVIRCCWTVGKSDWPGTKAFVSDLRSLQEKKLLPFWCRHFAQVGSPIETNAEGELQVHCDVQVDEPYEKVLEKRLTSTN